MPKQVSIQTARCNPNSQKTVEFIEKHLSKNKKIYYIKQNNSFIF